MIILKVSLILLQIIKNINLNSNMIILKEEMTEMEILKYPSFKFQYDNTLS